MPGFETLPLALVLGIAGIMFVAGTMQGAPVATPLIALFTDMRSAVILVLLPCLATVAVVVFRGGSLRPVLARFWMMPGYMLLGAAVGTRLFIAYPAFPYALLLSGLIFVYLNLDRLGRAEWPLIVRHRNAFGALFGVAAGVTEGTANVAAPALVIYYLGIGLPPVMLVQALNICFLTGKSTQFATLATSGGVSPVQWAVTLPLAVIAAAGTVWGMGIRSRIDAVTYRRWLRYALFAMAVVLAGQYGWATYSG
jgi:uncharacterized membrane protein YfcA